MTRMRSRLVELETSSAASSGSQEDIAVLRRQLEGAEAERVRITEEAAVRTASCMLPFRVDTAERVVGWGGGCPCNPCHA